jgi:hypothetical protein
MSTLLDQFEAGFMLSCQQIEQMLADLRSQMDKIVAEAEKSEVSEVSDQWKFESDAVYHHAYMEDKELHRVADVACKTTCYECGEPKTKLTTWNRPYAELVYLCDTCEREAEARYYAEINLRGFVDTHIDEFSHA